MHSSSNISADVRSPLFSLQEAILRAARLCKFLNRVNVQDEFYPNDKDGSVARDALRRLVARLLQDRVQIRPNDYVIQTAPVYVPTEAGCCVYQVRSWVGWHHPMALSLLALWFLPLERLRLGGKNAAGEDRRADAAPLAGCAKGAKKMEPHRLLRDVRG